MAEPSEAAHKIAEGHNAFDFRGDGSFLLFNRDGSGGEWYAADNWPAIGDSMVKVVLTHEPLTPDGAQRILDERFREE